MNPRTRYVPSRVLSSVFPVSSDLHHRASNNWCSLYLEALLPPKLLSPITPSPEIFHKPVLYKHQSTRLKSLLPISHTKTTQPSLTMFSCVNYERGCRGRCNQQNGRCDSCVTLNLQQVRTPSSSSISSINSTSGATYSAMTSSYASLSHLTAAKGR